ncbi:MAG TPA: M20/M25/M40 family metallo-hydrolase [Planctomycetota bacterium]
MSADLQRRLAALVAVASPSGGEAALAAQVVAGLVAAGHQAERVGDSVLARLRGRAAGPRVLLHSHLDTVAAGEGWTVDPFAAEWQDGRLVGLGANDAKASAAAMLHAFEAVAAAGLPQGELWLALTAREETDNAGMAAVLAATGKPDAAVCGEPTGLEVVRAQAGLAVIEVEWHGRACHAAHVARVDHDSALLAAAADLAESAPYLRLPGEHPLLGPSTAVATILESGSRHNVIPDRARAVFDARLMPPHDAEECVRHLRELFPCAEVRIRSARLQPIETAAGHPVVVAALAAAGRQAAIGSATMSDMALLQGVPVVKCGPGRTERSHAADEYVTAAELAAGAAFYTRAVPALLAALAPVEAGA